MTASKLLMDYGGIIALTGVWILVGAVVLLFLTVKKEKETQLDMWLVYHLIEGFTLFLAGFVVFCIGGVMGL
jgi:hypothetical protein